MDGGLFVGRLQSAAFEDFTPHRDLSNVSEDSALVSGGKVRFPEGQNSLGS